MARTTGPLFSIRAQGTLGGVITYQRRASGRTFLRTRPVPRNPKSAPQAAPRNAIRTIAQGILWTNTTEMFAPGETITDVARIRAAVFATATWTAALIKVLLGAELADYIAAITAWNALAPGERDAWDTAAATVVPPVRHATQRGAGDSTETPITAGNVFFVYRSGLYSLGLAPAPTGTPPVYTSGGGPTVQALYRVETTEYDDPIETEGAMIIAGLSITETFAGGWVHIEGSAMVFNNWEDYNLITCSIQIDEEDQLEVPGGQDLPYIYSGENRHILISHFVQLAAGEHTISMKALASASDAVIQSNLATLVVHDMGF
jgi:hypothetical protein